MTWNCMHSWYTLINNIQKDLCSEEHFLNCGHDLCLPRIIQCMQYFNKGRKDVSNKISIFIRIFQVMTYIKMPIIYFQESRIRNIDNFENILKWEWQIYETLNKTSRFLECSGVSRHGCPPHPPLKQVPSLEVSLPISFLFNLGYVV